MASAYKMLNEYHTGMKAGNTRVRESTQLAFAQKTMKCYGCGKIGYTLRTCPNCSKGGPSNKSRDDNRKSSGQDRKDTKKQDGKSFAQVKDKTKPKTKTKSKTNEQHTDLGFLQLGTVDENSVVEYSFMNVCKVDSSNKGYAELDAGDDDPNVDQYVQSGLDIIDGEFSEYFTPSLVREMKLKGIGDPDNCLLGIETSDFHKDTQLAQC